MDPWLGILKPLPPLAVWACPLLILSFLASELQCIGKLKHASHTSSVLNDSCCARSRCGRAAQVEELLQGPHGTKVTIAFEPADSTKDKVPPPAARLLLFPFFSLLWAIRVLLSSWQSSGACPGRRSKAEEIPHTASAPLTHSQHHQTTLAAHTPPVAP